MRKRKYIFVVGGVMSGVGKGVTTSSIALLLEARGIHVSPIKIDPYLNVDAGTMNPIEHGEVFVLRSGLECDQDMGNYERFLGRDLGNENYMTGGMVYKTVIDRERALGYGGRCVEPVPHIPEEIIRRIKAAGEASGAEVIITEIGGTLGEYQSVMFIEAARLLEIEYPGDVLFVLVSYLPVPHNLGEMKTKPTQYAVRTMNSYGVQPDIIIARGESALDAKRKEKIAFSSGMHPEQVISAPDVASIYDVPLNFEKDKLGETLLRLLGLRAKKQPNLSKWRSFVRKVHSPRCAARIAVVGKYFATGSFTLSDSYISVIEATKYAAYHLGMKPELTWIDAETFERNLRLVATLGKFDGIIVPGGFGSRGIEGVLSAITYARTRKIPYLGLCYGMQLMVVEFARNVAGLTGANTTEVNKKTPYPVIDIMPEQRGKLERGDYGGSMRLGDYPARIKRGTHAFRAYRKDLVHERHRHRYEVHPAYVERLEEAGMIFSGVSPSGKLMEIAELPPNVHPFMLGTQFHPEFTARPLSPNPLFLSFMRAVHSRK